MIYSSNCYICFSEFNKFNKNILVLSRIFNSPETLTAGTYINIITKGSRASCILLLFLLIYLPSLYSQTEISGVINTYSAVESVESNQSVTVSEPALFSPGDTVLLIQMRGFGVLTEPPGDYGIPHNINDAGNYEFLLIDEITGNTVTFTREFLKDYDPAGSIQLVKVKGYESATVTGTLTADPWNGTTGGILALMVTNTLSLEADIDLSIKGFTGGPPVERITDECSNADERETLSFPAGSDKAGIKGDGPATYYIEEINEIEYSYPIENNFVHGKGRLATGGGGGNGKFAGGGGGGNFGQGGFGGRESEDCPDSGSNGNETGGVGGYRLEEQLLDETGVFVNRFFLGGGGGGSTEFGTRKATSGGNGGGMVIIIANDLEGTEQYGIYADGESVATPSTAGAGGGGAGGTVITSTDNYIGTLNIYVRGGNGGDVDYPARAGTGGGGGGGSVIQSGTSLPPGVNFFVQPGASGTNIQQNDPFGSTIGTPGGLIEELEISLNGLLFNGIRTSRLLVCEDTSPDIIEGTQPRGGIKPYEYEWLMQTGSEEWTVIAGATEMDFQPGPLSENTSFMRVVKDQSVPSVIDSSNYITVTIQPKIIGNTISDEQTICEGETAEPLEGPSPVQGGTGSYEYQWIMSEENSADWTLAENENEQLSYSPPPLFESTSYRRIATSGVCTDSSNIVPVVVHPSITNNILDEDQTICYGDTPQPVNPAGQISGGDGSYAYTWEQSTDETWQVTDNNGNQATYSPGELFDTTRYRRTVISGACTDTSPPHSVFVLPSISFNSISGSQTICYMTSPEIFTGSTPEGGDGDYSYLWESAAISGSWSEADGSYAESDYLSPALTDTTYFRRIVFSGLNDVCKDTSNLVQVEFHPFSFAELVSITDTLCMGEQRELTFNLQGDGPWDLVFASGTVEYSADEITGPVHTIEVSPTSQDSTTHVFNILSLSDSHGCLAPTEGEYMKGEASLRVYAFPNTFAGDGGEICGSEYRLNAVPDLGKGLWTSPSASAGYSPDNTKPDALVEIAEYGTHQFRWTETNWQCATSDEITVTFYEQPDQPDAGEDQDLRFIFETSMEGSLPDNIPTAYGLWVVVEGNGSIVFPNEEETMVTDLAFGENIFEWTIYNGVCEPVSDIVTITVKDIEAPNGFSPNNSGYNDRFIVRGIENSSDNELIIFNRQGNIVYKTVNYQNDWDGKDINGRPLPEDTYYYILNVDNQYSYKGFIVLKR